MICTISTSTAISGRLPARQITCSGQFCHMEKNDSANYPHWQITRTQKQRKIMQYSSRTHKIEVMEQFESKPFMHFLIELILQNS